MICFVKGIKKRGHNPFPDKPLFSPACSTKHLLETQLERQKLLVKRISPSPTGFSSLMENFLLFSSCPHVICKLFQFWGNLKFVDWERVNPIRNKPELRCLFKTLWEKERVVGTSIFSFSPTMFSIQL